MKKIITLFLLTITLVSCYTDEEIINHPDVIKDEGVIKEEEVTTEEEVIKEDEVATEEEQEVTTDEEVIIDEENENYDIVGTWNWIGTDGGIAYHIHDTPASTGKEIQIQFMNNHTYSILRNGNVISKGTYELTTQKSIYSGKMERFIRYSENTGVQDVVISGIISVYDTNRLTIAENHYEGLGSTFFKD